MTEDLGKCKFTRYVSAMTRFPCVATCVYTTLENGIIAIPSAPKSTRTEVVEFGPEKKFKVYIWSINELCNASPDARKLDYKMSDFIT